MKKIDFRNVKNLIVRRALQKRFSDFMFWYSDNYSKHKDNNAYSEWETPAGYRDGYGDTTHTDEKIHSDYSFLPRL